MAQLAAEELYAVLAARQQVFAVEQHCAFLDADGHDAHAWHLLGWIGDRGPPSLAAYLRVLDPGRKFAEPSIGAGADARAASRHRDWARADGGGDRAHARSLAPAARSASRRSSSLETFYKTLGFRTASSPYIEDDIPHVDMLLEAA